MFSFYFSKEDYSKASPLEKEIEVLIINMIKQTYIIWNLKDVPINKELNSVLIFWDNPAIIEDDYQISVLKLIESNKTLVKDEYLKWVADLALDTRLNAFFTTDSNYSLWLSSVLLSKHVMSRSYNIEILKLIALNVYVKENNVRRIKIESDDYRINSILLKYCIENNIEVVNASFIHLHKMFKFRSLNSMFFAMFWIFRFYLKTINIKRLHDRFYPNHLAKITIFTYFDISSISSRNENKYWIGIAKFLNDHNIKSNWIHLSSSDDNGIKSKSVNEKFKQNYVDSGQNEKHLLLIEFMSIGIFFKVLFTWCKNLLQYIKYSNKIRIPKICGFDVNILVVNDLRGSLIGQYCISNITYFYLISKILKSFNYQKLCIYPHENQSWEYSLIYNWKKLFGSKIIGNAHSSIRYWDLRYFNHSDYFSKNIDYSFPDLIAVNSILAKELLVNSGTPDNRIVEVEALRYNYILDLDTAKKCNNSKEVLILGDYSKSITEKLLEVIYQTFKELDGIRFFIKFHPQCILELSKYEQINFTIVDNPISEILTDYEVCLSSVSTTAAIEFFEKGKKVITYVNGINFSPLWGCQNVSFVYNKIELLNSVLYNLEISKINPVGNYFFLNKTIPTWKKIIANSIR